MRRFAYAAVLIWSFTSLGDHAASGQDDYFIVDTVIFYPVTSSGENPPFTITSLVDQADHEFVSHCREGGCFRFRKGSYTYSIKLSANGRVVTGPASLFSKKQWLTINLGPAVGTVGDFEGRPLRGRVEGIPKSRQPAWLRMQALYADSSVETPIDERGAFDFETVPPGRWILLVMQGMQVLSSRTYSYEDGTEITIDLRAR